MSNCIEVFAIVEGKTEQIFVEKILAPYLVNKNIWMYATQVSKPGQKGGDVRFSRVTRDIRGFLKQRSDTYVTTFVDYYGIKEWPGLDLVVPQNQPNQIAMKINEATKREVVLLFPNDQADRRFIPFIAVHEFEALLFSDAKILSRNLGIRESVVLDVLAKCGSPEAINNGPKTAPSKRLNGWMDNQRFLKTTMGITIAEEIGIDKIREECSIFNSWLNIFEDIQSSSNY